MTKRRTKTKLTLTLVLGLSLGAVLFYFLHFRQSQNLTQRPLTQAAAKAAMALSKVRQTATKDGIVQWKLEADTAEMDADTGQMVLQSPEINFFLEDGSQVHLTAQKGILHTRDNNMEVQGNVHLRSDRYTLVTEALAYDNERRVITTSQAVRINGKTIQLNAATMTYDLTTNQALFGGPVKGILNENPVM
jgi:LPS export ABC transporter protein LptC